MGGYLPVFEDYAPNPSLEHSVSLSTVEEAIYDMFGLEVTDCKSVTIQWGTAVVEFWPDGKDGDLVTRRYYIDNQS